MALHNPRKSDQGDWLPPKMDHGSRELNTSDPCWYSCDGYRIQRLNGQEVRSRDFHPDERGGEIYRHCTASVYQAHDSMQVTNVDATREAVGDGRLETRAGNLESHNNFSDWMPLSFNWETSTLSNGRTQKLSYITHAGEHGKFHSEHWNDRNPDAALHRYFPMRYHAERQFMTDEQSRSLVIGDLAILIALFALTIPQGSLDNAFSQYYHNRRFLPHNYSDLS